MPATAPEPICLDPLAWSRHEREVAAWREQSQRESDAFEALYAVVRPEVKQVIEDALAANPTILGQPPEHPGDLWACPTCDRRFPSDAATSRHMEFEH